MPTDFRQPRRATSAQPPVMRLLLRLALVLFLMVAGYFGSRSELLKPAPAPPGDAQVIIATKPSSPATQPAEATAEALATTLDDVTIYDEDGEIAYRGTIELAPTLERIAAGKHLSFTNDGSVFQNRERRLPKQRSGYYHEWVHPTPKLRGPGPQRIVTGDEGEVFYTSDHYRTFQRIK
ncbi:MAG TPA: ribonuclease domain-containing protein [Pirellulaceae bacterium]|nr:ribonuclease domain-containing protein [Pirellulaceae bacterium]